MRLLKWRFTLCLLFALSACSNTSDPSLDGRIAYKVCEDEFCQSESVYVMNADGSNAQRIAAGAYPVWSPDGTRLAYMAPANSNAPLPLQVYIYDTRTQQSVPLHEGRARPSLITWSPDGTEIAIAASGETTGADTCTAVIWIVAVDGSDSRQLTSQDACDSDPNWSPDGTHIAFTRSANGSQRVYFVKVDGSDLRRMPELSTDAVWSPDGTQFAFQMNLPETETKLFLAALDGTFRQLTDIEFEHAWVRWSPDGKQIAFTVDYTLDHRLHLINADGTDLRTLLDIEWRPEELDWSPDGSRIVVTVRRNSTREPFLYSIKPDGTGGQALTKEDSLSASPDWASPASAQGGD